MIDREFLEILACPACRAPLEQVDETLVCTSESCGLIYPIDDGIPILLVEEARRPERDDSSPSS